MSNAQRVLSSRSGPAWLPDGGRADVVLAGTHGVVPSPTCLVRLIATHGDVVLTVPRADGGGLDIPTRRVGDEVVADCLQALLVRVGGSLRNTSLLGYVRNRVHEAPDDYPWPSPDAYFTVWHCQMPMEANAEGTWLDAAEAEIQLSARHWWPLAAHLLRFGALYD